MALAAILTAEAHGKLSAELQKEYNEKDGKFVLDVTPVDGFQLDNSAGLKSSLQKERKRADDAVKNLKAFDGLDPEAAREALKLAEEVGNWDPDEKLKKSKEQYEKQLKEKYDNELKTFKTKAQLDLEAANNELKSTTSQLDQVMIHESAAAAIERKKGVKELLLPIVTGSIRRVKKDGKHFVEVVDKEGLPRLSSKSGSTDPMSIDEFVDELRGHQVYARAFEGTGASGSGADGGSATRQSGSRFTINAADAKDPARYRAVREEAAKAGQPLVMTE